MKQHVTFVVVVVVVVVVVFNVPPSAKVMETGSRLNVSSERLVKLGIEPTTPGLQGKRLIHYTTAASVLHL